MKIIAYICCYKHVKIMDNKVLFTTEDGFEITGKDKYFSVKIREYPQHPLFKGKTPVPLYSIAGPYINPKATEPTGDILYFFKRENAEKYVSKMKGK